MKTSLVLLVLLGSMNLIAGETCSYHLRIDDFRFNQESIEHLKADESSIKNKIYRFFDAEIERDSFFWEVQFGETLERVHLSIKEYYLEYSFYPWHGAPGNFSHVASEDDIIEVAITTAILSEEMAETLTIADLRRRGTSFNIDLKDLEFKYKDQVTIHGGAGFGSVSVELPVEKLELESKNGFFEVRLAKECSDIIERAWTKLLGY